MKDWFYRLTTRDQLSLLLLAAVVSLYLVYMLLWSPLTERRDQMAQRNLVATESLQRVDSMVSEILRLRDAGGGQARPGNLTGIINQSTASAGLSVSRLQPNSRGEVQVRLEAVSFDSMLGWLNTLEGREGLLVQEVSVTQAGEGGLVNATVRLGQGS